MASSSSTPAPETDVESAPLLDTSDASDDSAPTPRPQLGKPIFILTILSLILSALTWPFLITIFVFWSHEPRNYHGGWEIKDLSSTLVGLSIATFVFALANLLRLRFWRAPLPLLINLIADTVLAIYVLAISAHGIAEAQDYNSPCYAWAPYPRPIKPLPVDPKCPLFAYRVWVLEEVVMSLGVVLGITSVVLLVLRCILAYRSKFWQGVRSVRLPTGTFSVEFTVKLLRQEEQSAAQPAVQPAS